MFRQFTAATLIALAASACSAEVTSSEELGTTQQEIVACDVTGLEWKPFLAHLAYDAAEDFGRWEFTTDLKINGDRLAISDAGYSLCYQRGRNGCPAMTAGLSAQEGWSEIQNDKGKVMMNPNTIRSQLVEGFRAQVINEQNQQWIGDSSEPAPYNNFQSPSKTGLPHTLSLANCAATVYADPNFTGTSQCLRTGSYRMADLKVGNDRISAIKVRSGMKVTMYEHDGFSGSNAVFTSDNSYTTSFNDRASSLVVSMNNTYQCSAIDTYKVSTTGDWTKVRAKLVTLGYMRGNDILDVRLDLLNGLVDVDPYNVDFVPPTTIAGTTGDYSDTSTYGVAVKSATAETWRSTDDPAPSILPVGGSCRKKPYGMTSWYKGTVRSSGSYRFCYLN